MNNAAAVGPLVRTIADPRALQRLPLEASPPVTDPRELAATRLGCEPSHQPQRDRGGPITVRRPWLAHVDLTTHEHGPGRADLGRERSVALRGASLVIRAA